MTEEHREPTLYPPWKQAMHELKAADLRPGQIIEKEWLEQRFGITKPKTIADYQRNALTFLRMFDQLRESLLQDERLMLRSVPGVGYRVIDPAEQATVAQKDRLGEVRNALSKLIDETTYVRTEMLTDAQRKELSDAQARIGGLQGLLIRRMKKRIEGE